MLVDEDETQGNFDQVENETNEQPVEQVVAQEETKPIIPEKYQGKSVDDIIRMHQEAEKLIGKQAQEVGEVRRLADDLIKQNLQTNHKPIVEEPEVDFFEDPQKAIRRTVDQHPDVLAAKQATQDFKRMNIQQKLAATHPDFQQVVQDAGFTEWVKASPVRLGLYAKADGEYDFDSANELLSTYKQLKQVQTKQVAAVDNTVRQQSLKAASVDVGGTGESSKKIYRRADLIQLRMRDPDRYEALQPEIMAAYAEGRIK
jgi:putative ubiquitin-RnfH superfamily antitoxin RatB of RatAB toxin-antitoxin module